MYIFIALGLLIILILLWMLYKLHWSQLNRPMPSPPPPTESTKTSSSIAITEDDGAAGMTTNEWGKRQTPRSYSKRDPLKSGISDDSLKSKNSFGFVPSIRSVAPISNRGHRGTQNFLMLLDSLDALDDDELKRSRQKPQFTAASGSGIEASSSDETASQTLIGKELDKSKDPGRIQLDYIKVQDN